MWVTELGVVHEFIIFSHVSSKSGRNCFWSKNIQYCFPWIQSFERNVQQKMWADETGVICSLGTDTHADFGPFTEEWYKILDLKQMDVYYRQETSSWHSMAQMWRHLFVCIASDFLPEISEKTLDEIMSFDGLGECSCYAYRKRGIAYLKL